MANRFLYFGIFDTLKLKKEKAHLAGKIAEALMANGTLLATDPVIEFVELLAINSLTCML
jgi:hypothetical protein